MTILEDGIGTLEASAKLEICLPSWPRTNHGSARQRGLRIGVVTKSTLIERDIPLLQRIAERNTLVLHLTITTPNAALARLLEPRGAPALPAVKV
jgi:DNA repair photolyase